MNGVNGDGMFSKKQSVRQQGEALKHHHPIRSWLGDWLAAALCQWWKPPPG